MVEVARGRVSLVWPLAGLMIALVLLAAPVMAGGTGQQIVTDPAGDAVGGQPARDWIRMGAKSDATYLHLYIKVNHPDGATPSAPPLPTGSQITYEAGWCVGNTAYFISPDWQTDGTWITGADAYASGSCVAQAAGVNADGVALPTPVWECNELHIRIPRTATTPALVDGDVMSEFYITTWDGQPAGITFDAGAAGTYTMGQQGQTYQNPPTVTATPQSTTSVQVSWTPAADNGAQPVLGWKLYRNAVQIGTMPYFPAATTTFLDTGLTPNTSYTYTVRAVNCQGDSAASAGVVATTPGTTTPPTGLGVSITGGPTFTYNLGAAALNLPAVITNMNPPLSGTTCIWTTAPAGTSALSPGGTGCTSLTADAQGFTATTVGTYTVTIVVDDDGSGPRSATTQVTVNVVDPNAVRVSAVGPSTATQNSQVTFQATVSNGGASPTCTWTIDPPVPMASSSCTGVTVNPDRPGTYQLTFSASRGTGPTDSASTQVILRVVVPDRPAVDTDQDGLADDQDNCPTIANPDQGDHDRDGIGNACDDDYFPPTPTQPAPTKASRAPPDKDADGIADAQDNCPDTPNANQLDLDRDGIGNACDSDADGDQINDLAADNCPTVFNPDQRDSDSNGVGDACQAKTVGAASPGGIQKDCPNCSGNTSPLVAATQAIPTGALFLAAIAGVVGMVLAAVAIWRR